MDNEVTLALISTVQHRVETLNGLIRRFEAERNPEPADTCRRLIQYELSRAAHGYRQAVASGSHRPDSTIAARALNALIAAHDVFQLADVPRDEPEAPPATWHTPRINIIVDASAMEQLAEEAVAALHAGDEDDAVIFSEAVYALDRRANAQRQDVEATSNRQLPRPKGSNRSLQNQVIGATIQQYDANVRIRPIRRRYMNVTVCPALAINKPDTGELIELAENFRNNPVDIVTSRIHTTDSFTGASINNEIVFFEYEDSICVKTVEENFPTGYTYADLYLHTQAILQNAQRIEQTRSPQQRTRANYLRHAVSWTLRFYRAELHDVHQLDIHDLLIKATQAGYEPTFLRDAVLPIIANHDRELAELIARQTGFDRTPEHPPDYSDQPPISNDDVIATAFTIGLPYPTVEAIAALIPASVPTVWADVEPHVRAAIAARNHAYLASRSNTDEAPNTRQSANDVQQP